MKIKINAKSDSCNCQVSTDSGCASERKSEAPIDKRFAWAGVILLIIAAFMFLVAHSLSNAPKLNWLQANWINWAQVVEVFGLMWFGVAMARWRG